QRIFRRVVEVLVEGERDDVRRRLRPGAVELGVLLDADAKGPGKRSLDSGEADFAVALRAMAVADREQPARREHRQMQRRAGDEVLAVDIATEDARDH